GGQGRDPPSVYLFQYSRWYRPTAHQDGLEVRVGMAVVIEQATEHGGDHRSDGHVLTKSPGDRHRVETGEPANLGAYVGAPVEDGQTADVMERHGSQPHVLRSVIEESPGRLDRRRPVVHGEPNTPRRAGRP